MRRAAGRAWEAALIASLVAHAALVVRAGRMREGASEPPPPAPADTVVDRWAGETVEIAEEGSEGAARPGATPTPTATPTATATATATGTATGTATATATAIATAKSARRAAARSGAGPERLPGDRARKADGEAGTGARGAFGAEGEAGVRDLVRAFTRAIPVASSADPGWSEAPLGSLGASDVTLALAADGTIAEATVAPGAPPVVARLVRRTVAMLGAARFATGDGASAVHAKLRLETRVAPDATPVPDGRPGAYGLGFEPATPEHPARAWFVLPIGRRVETTVAPARGVR